MIRIDIYNITNIVRDMLTLLIRYKNVPKKDNVSPEAKAFWKAYEDDYTRYIRKYNNHQLSIAFGMAIYIYLKNVSGIPEIKCESEVGQNEFK